MTVKGADLSQWQATTPPLDGLSFVIARATYGTAADTGYAGHADNVRAAGLPLGAYAFGTYGDGAAQADALVASPTRADFYALDLESDEPYPPMTDAQARAFIARMHARGYRCGLYHSKSGYPSDALGADWRWVAAWGLDPGTGWTIHQYRGAPLDLDVFNGDAAAFAAFVTSNRPKGGSVKPSISPSAEPVVWTGIITSLLLAAIQFATGHGLLTSDQAASLTPQVAIIANGLVSALPFLLSLVSRQAVTPNSKITVPAAASYITVSTGSAAAVTVAPPVIAPVEASPVALSVFNTTALPAGTTGTIGANTRRWSLAGEPDSNIGPSTLEILSLDFLAGPINGHFYRTGTEPQVYIEASAVSFAATDAAPAPTSAPAEPTPVADPWAGQPPLATPAAETQFGLAYSAEIAAALARYLDASDVWLRAHGLSDSRNPRIAIPQAVNIALAASVNASILRVAGYFGPETPGVSA